MRKYIVFLCLLLLLQVMPPPHIASANPITVIITTAVKKVLKAMDLAIQRLQNETIRLQNAQKALENLLHKLKLKEIFEWSEKQRTLFAGYYEELLKVRSAIAYYQRVRSVIELQVQLVNEYRQAIRILSTTKSFTPNEIEHILEVYAGILDHSIRNVEQISTVVKSFSLQMSDADRLALIHQVNRDIQHNLNDLRAFTNQNAILAIQRLKDETEIQTIKGLLNLH